MKKRTIVGGLDEAGRGAVIGPLTIAGVSIEKEKEGKLKALGIKDSKELSPKEREKLSKEIEKIAKDIFIMHVSPCRIDAYMKAGMNLNMIEIMRFADVADMLRVDVLYVDSPETNTEKFAKKLLAKMETKPKVVSENKADSKYLVVAAASIIAKVARDEEIEKLRKKYGVRGSGYPSDEETIKWMEEYLEKHKKFPEKGLVRFSWDTTKQILSKRKQRKLFGFLRI